MATAAKLITVAEFLERPDVPGGYEELRRGEVYVVAWPNQGHASLQHRMRKVLERVIGDSVVVTTEMAFRARPEYELRRADIGVIGVSRWEQTDENDFIKGAPEIVIEVESPSNTAREFREKEDLCLANGAVEFWVVYPDLRTVTVAVAEGSRTYRDGEEIELRGFAEKRVAVSELLGPVRAS
ncbi:MAG: Uma2 family endonuclease [Bryobacteraceae bacterium]